MLSSRPKGCKDSLYRLLPIYSGGSFCSSGIRPKRFSPCTRCCNANGNVIAVDGGTALPSGTAIDSTAPASFRRPAPAPLLAGRSDQICCLGQLAPANVLDTIALLGHETILPTRQNTQHYPNTAMVTAMAIIYGLGLKQTSGRGHTQWISLFIH